MVTKRALFLIILVFSLLFLWMYTAFPYQGSLVHVHSIQPSNDNLPSVRQGNISQQQLRTVVNGDTQTESEEYTNNDRLNETRTSHRNISHSRKIEPNLQITSINPTVEKLRTKNERQKSNTSERINSIGQQKLMNSTRGRVIGDGERGKKKTNIEKNISHVQEKNMNSRNNSLVSFLENKSSSLQEKKKKSPKGNLADRYIRNTNFDNSSFMENITEVSKLYRATLIPLQEFGRQVLLYSAILGNSSDNTTWDRLSIQGWEATNLSHQVYSCCIFYNSGIVKVVPVSRKIGRAFAADLRSKQFICYLSGLNDYQKELPVSVTLRSNDSQAECPTIGDMYVKIEYAYGHQGKFAIFGKIIYGDISGADLLAWFEIHRQMGADKMVFYPLKLGKNATKVLRYYENLGLAEIVPFTIPNRDFYDAHLKFLAGAKLFNHEGVALTDSLERLQGYKYMAGFDVDEYLVPTKNETLLSLFERLFKKYPDAAGFTFGTYLYITDWKPTSNMSMFAIKTYLSRTVLTNDRNKHYVLPDRVIQTSAHSFAAKKPFTRHRVLEEDAAIRHYRRCRRSYKDRNETCFEFQRYTDNHLYRIFKPIEKRVLRLKQQLGV